MFQRILVPLDGSTRAEQAIPVAARIARASGGTIVCLRVVSPPLEFWPSLVPPLPSAALQTLIEVERVEASRYLTRLTASNELAGIGTAAEVRSGSAALAILAGARSQQSDLIMMCSHGYTATTRWRLGSVAEKITRYAPVPVLLLPKPWPVPAHVHADAERPLRALVPLDGSPLAEVALMPAVQLVTALATPTRRALHLMQVVKLPAAEDEQRRAYLNASMKEQARGEATRYLTTLADCLRKGTLAGHVQEIPPEITITWSVAFDVDVAQALMRAAENEEDAPAALAFGGCDVIAIATRGRGGFTRWSMGNVTERVLHGTKLPLLIVPEQDGIDKS
jgi:nucleotide-binding universal stress UspA family protein